jgi:hypothetical protein
LTLLIFYCRAVIHRSPNNHYFKWFKSIITIFTIFIIRCKAPLRRVKYLSRGGVKTMALKGRPKLHEEPPVKKNFDLPRVLVEELASAAQKRRQPVVAIVRTALEKELELDNDFDPRHRKTPPVKQSDLKAAMLEALEEHEKANSNIHRITLSAELNKKLVAASKNAGFAAPAQLVEEVLRVLLREPAQLSELIMSKALLDIEKVLGLLPERATRRSKKPGI